MSKIDDFDYDYYEEPVKSKAQKRNVRKSRIDLKHGWLCEG